MRDELREVIVATLADPDLDEGSTQSYTCRKCKQRCYADTDLDPAPLCDTCAHEAAQMLALEVARIYQALATLAPPISGPLLAMLNDTKAVNAQTFMLGVVDRATKAVLEKKTHRRGKHRK